MFECRRSEGWFLHVDYHLQVGVYFKHIHRYGTIILSKRKWEGRRKAEGRKGVRDHKPLIIIIILL